MYIKAYPPLNSSGLSTNRRNTSSTLLYNHKLTCQNSRKKKLQINLNIYETKTLKKEKKNKRVWEKQKPPLTGETREASRGRKHHKSNIGIAEDRELFGLLDDAVLALAVGHLARGQVLDPLQSKLPPSHGYWIATSLLVILQVLVWWMMSIQHHL